MTYLYFILSPAKNKIYVGVTSNLQERLRKHNDHLYAGAFSKIATDWELIFQKEFEDKQEALFLERFIKRMKSRKFIQKIIENPEILNDILSKRK
jgi:putative endonuclease